MLRKTTKILAINLAVWLLLEGSAFAVLAVMRSQERDSEGWQVHAEEAFRTGLYVWDDDCLWRLEPGYSTRFGSPFWGDEPLVLNEHGMRSPSVPLEKPAGVQRILILGGSHPMGMYVKAEQAYGARVERRLAEVAAGRWQVLNASAPGHTSYQGARWLEKYGLAFDPDIVITDLGSNDMLPLTPEFPTPDHEVRRAPAWVTEATSVLQVSAVYRLLRRLLKKNPEATPTDSFGTRVSPERHAQNIRAMRALGAQHGFQVLPMAQVNVDVQQSGFARCIFPETDLAPMIDVCSIFVPMEGRAGDYFVDIMHATADGHALIADLVVKRLLELRLVQP